MEGLPSDSPTPSKHLMAGPKGNSEKQLESLGVSAFSFHDCKKYIFLTRSGTQICRGFKVHDLITSESKVQVVVSLGH